MRRDDQRWYREASDLGADAAPPSTTESRLSGGHPYAGPVGVGDLPARPERGGDEFEVGDAERDPDDRQALGNAGDDVRQGEPPAGDDHPEDVGEAGGNAGAGSVDDGAAERPQRVDGRRPPDDPSRGYVDILSAVGLGVGQAGRTCRVAARGPSSMRWSTMLG